MHIQGHFDIIFHKGVKLWSVFVCISSMMVHILLYMFFSPLLNCENSDESSDLCTKQVSLQYFIIIHTTHNVSVQNRKCFVKTDHFSSSELSSGAVKQKHGCCTF